MKRLHWLWILGITLALAGCPTADDDDAAGGGDDDDASDDDDDDDTADDDDDDDDTELPPDSELWVDNEAGDDMNPGTEDEPFATIAAAFDHLDGLTHIHVVATGTSYEGVCVWDDDLAIIGEGGVPVLDAIVSCDGRNALLFSRGNDVRFQNLRLDATAYAGQSVRAVIFSGLPDEPIYRNVAREIDAEGPGFGQAGRSLISSSLCYDCVLEDSSSVGAEEHGIYWTNHQDGSIIRNNYVEAADGACLQLNADPETNDPEHPFTDGIMSDGIVEGNILYDCGDTGGSALNLAGVEDTVFVNNIIYGNALTGGIANWDDGWSDWGDEGNFDFGCKRNLFAHNTIDCRNCDRHGVSFRNGSVDNTFVNNIVITDTYDAAAVDAESDSGLVIDYNVYVPGTIFEDTDEDWIDLGEWQALGFDTHAITATVEELFEAGAGNYHLLPGCPAVDAGTDAGVISDMDGDSRPQGAGPDIGADEAQ